MVIGEAPGAAESRTGKPFMGQSGKLLREELAKNGLHSVYITNIAKCRPPDNRAPTNSEIAACREYLDEEIATIKPKFVVALGSLASKSVLGRDKITKCHGEFVKLEKYTGVPIYHPAYTLYDASKLPAFQADIARLAREVRGQSDSLDIEWEIVGRHNLDQFIAEFKQAEEFAFDAETTSLFPYDGRGKILCLDIALWKRSWVLPLGMPGSTFPTFQTQREIVSIIVELSKEKLSIAQNGKFDNEWLQICYGEKFHLDFDTMIASHTLDENRDHDLKSMARNNLGAPEYDLSKSIKKDLEGSVLRGSISAQDVYLYNALDGAYTLRLKRIFDRQLREDSALRKLFYRLIMPGARTMENIECRGLTLNLERRDKIEIETVARVERLHGELQKIAPINWNAPKQVGTVLFGQLGLPVIMETATGQPATGEEVLIELKDRHPVANLLVEYREASKFLSTYIVGWKDYMVGNLLFLSYKVHGTVTGRYSSRLHSIPRDDSIRSLVEAPPGWNFVQADISQAEMRIAAVMSRCPELERCFNSGIDVHWRTLLRTIEVGAAGSYVPHVLATARKLAKRELQLGPALEWLLRAGHEECNEIWKPWKEGRKRAKGINFGFLFGMFERKFIQYCKTKFGFEPTLDEASAFRRAYFDLYIGLAPWHERQKKLTRLNGQVRNLFGRVRRLPGIQSTNKFDRLEAERQGINSPVQGMVGDYKVAAMVEVEDTIPIEEFRLVGEHHDALLGLVREGCESRVLSRVAAIMRHPRLLDSLGVTLNIPMEVEISVGRWGQGITIKV